MRHSQSHLSSLATLLQNAEARYSATPPVANPTDKDDSGLIDILAMQRQAQEERARTTVKSTTTPVPVVTSVRAAPTDPDLVASLAKSKRRMKVVIGVVAGAAALLVVGIGIRFSHRDARGARAAIVAPPVAAAAAPVAPAPAPVAPPVAPPVVQPAAPVAAPETVAWATPPPVKTKKGHKRSKAKGSKLTKASSGEP